MEPLKQVLSLLIGDEFMQLTGQVGEVMPATVKVPPANPLNQPRFSVNGIAVLASFFLPGLGQFIQGRQVTGIKFFVGAVLAWVVSLGWVIHILAAVEAGKYEE